jgi:hypothetical protein
VSSEYRPALLQYASADGVSEDMAERIGIEKRGDPIALFISQCRSSSSHPV